MHSEDEYNHSPNVPRIIAGHYPEYVITHVGRSQYSKLGGGVSACGLAALNCARVVLSVQAAGLGAPQLVDALTKREFLEEVLRPCLTWSSPAHLEVEDIHKVPIFQRSLHHVRSSYGLAEMSYFRELLSEVLGFTKQHSRSTCVIITRPPEIIACFCISGLPSDLFVIFDSHPRPDKHPHGAAFIFKNSVDVTAEYLAHLLHYDEHLLRDTALQWQAQLLSHCSGNVFTAPDTSMTDQNWSELALDASLQMLSLQARVRELETNNEALEADNKRYREENSDLEDKLLELDDEFERMKKKYKALKKSGSVTERQPGPSSSPRASATPGLGYSPESPLGTTLTRFTTMNATIETNASHTRALEKRPEGKEAQAHDADVALDLQRQYDQEDQHLQQQYRFLKDTAPAIFKCAICLERYQEDFVVRLMPCGHMFCRGCMTAHAVSTIESHRYPISCPSCVADQGHGDPSELDVESLQQLGLTEKQYERYNEMQLARFSTIVHCQKRVASCKRTIFVDKQEYQQTSEVVCPFPKCGYAWCKMCSQALDPSGPKHSCDGSSELRHLMGERGWKACPGCDTPTEKTGGCNHMTCMSPACNTHFCYLCGKLIVKTSRRSTLKSALAKHYRRCTLFEYR